MPTTNYFKCAKEPFFFDDKDAASVARAYLAARARQASFGGSRPPPIVVWSRPLVSGEWSDVRLLGESAGVVS